jgi:glycerol-3-phosphate dehydrogenase
MEPNFTRAPSKLSNEDFDVLVVGGGIHGACVARDAAMRGLRVALIERSDFGSATSHNSLKLIHGGIRYLQHVDFFRVRQSIKERRFWLSCAPHLVRPLKCVMPAFGYGPRGILALGAATKLFDLLSTGCNRGMPVSQQLPDGGVISKDRLVNDLPGIDRQGLKGAMFWHDAQVEEADRALLECVISAAEEGAVVNNYVGADELLLTGSDVVGVRATDHATGSDLEIRASITVNTAGPWASHVASGAVAGAVSGRLLGLSKCMNLVVRRKGGLDLPPYAFAVVSNRMSDSLIDKNRRMFFVTPWKGLTIIGTSHLPYDGDPDDVEFGEADIQDFLNEVNESYPFGLSIEDVIYCYGGLTPAEEGLRRDQVRRARHGEIIDHYKAHEIGGLVSVIGVKYTTARLVGEQTTDLVFRKLGRVPPQCRTATTLLPGARDSFSAGPLIDVTGINLGSREGLDHLRSLVRAVAESQMVVTLEDLVYRRSNLAETGSATRELVELFGHAAGNVLGWEDKKVEFQIRDSMRRLLHNDIGNGESDHAPSSAVTIS